MVCCLCLNELKINEFIHISNYCNAKYGIAEIIMKYFGIEVNAEDAVSNKICNTCWKHLDDFHRFWLFIKEKQQTFQNLADIKCDPLEDNFKEEPSPLDKNDVKDVQLHELSIINESAFVKAELNSEEIKEINIADVDTDKDDVMSHDETDDDSDYLPKQQTRCKALKIKNTTSVKTQRRVFSAKQLKTDDNTKLICEICNKESANKKALQRHMTRQHPLEQRKVCSSKKLKTDDDTQLKCKVCGKKSTNKYALKKHMDRRHPSEQELNFSCNLCVKKFAKKYLLDDHTKRHSVDKKRKTCRICKKCFCSQQELQEHQKSEHPEERKIVCDSCGKSFKTKVGYKYHYKNEHLGIALGVQCPICNGWLKNRTNLVQHMYKHRDESSGIEFVCSICGAVKSTKQKLTRHKRNNHPNKMHKCTMCSKEFKKRIMLEEHIAAIHTGQPLYTCSFCPQTFKSNANMYSHKKRLHPTECLQKKIMTRAESYGNKNVLVEAEQMK